MALGPTRLSGPLEFGRAVVKERERGGLSPAALIVAARAAQGPVSLQAVDLEMPSLIELAQSEHTLRRREAACLAEMALLLDPAVDKRRGWRPRRAPLCRRCQAPVDAQPS